MQLLADIVAATVLAILLCILISKSWREKITTEIMRRTPTWIFWIAAIGLVNICALPIISKYGFDTKRLVLLSLYFLAPTLVLTLKQWRNWGSFADLFVALLIFIPVAYRWVPAWINGIPIAYWGGSIYLLATLPRVSNLEMYVTWKLGRNDLKFVAAAIPVLFMLIVPLAISVNFLVPGMQRFHAHGAWQIPFIFVGIFISIAIPEELLCRVVIQGVLAKRFGNVVGILLAAIIFGFGHITRVVKNSQASFGYPNWWYVLFAIIASLGYGYVYYKRRSLIACAVLHACVDLIWSIFFRN